MQRNFLSIKTHTASDAGFVVNSHLIMGKKEAILVDAQFTRSEAKKVAEMIKATGKTLKTIYITHGHPDQDRGAWARRERVCFGAL